MVGLQGVRLQKSRILLNEVCGVKVLSSPVSSREV